MEGKENADVMSNGEMNCGVEPIKQDGPNSDAMEVKNYKRKIDEGEASEDVEEKMPQLKKKRIRKRKMKSSKKVEDGKIKEEGAEGLDHNETGSTQFQFVVKTDESIVRNNVEMSLQVYVRGIPYYPTEVDIRSYFEGCGTITSIDRMTFPDSGKFRGTAIITYKTEAAATRALALDGSYLGDLFFKIQPYKSTTVNKLPNFSPSVVDGCNRIYIGNLSRDTTEYDLWTLFADCAVTSIRFGEDEMTGTFKGYAHVDFADGLSLNTALKLDQTIVCGRPVRISCAVPHNATGTKLIIPLQKDNQEDSGKRGNTAKLGAAPRDSEVDKSNVSVVENQVTRGTKLIIPLQKDNQEDSGKRGNTAKLGAAPRDSEVDKSNVSVVENQVTRGTKLIIPLQKDNQEDSGKRGNTAKLGAAPRDSEVDKSNVSVVENQVTRGTKLIIPLQKDNQEDSGKRGNTAKLGAAPRDSEVDKSNVSVVENQVTRSGTNGVVSACPEKLAADSPIPGQMIVSSEKKITGTNAIRSFVWKRIGYKCPKYGHLSSSCPKKLATDSTNPDNQGDSGKTGKFTKFEATPIDNEVDQRNVSVVVGNQVTCSGTNTLSSKKRKRKCYVCREPGHHFSCCPKKLATDSTNPGQMIVSSEKKITGTNAISSFVWKRIGYKCPKYGHLSSSCPKKLATDSTNPDNQGDSGKTGKFTKFEATPIDNEVDQRNVSVVVGNQVTCSGANTLSSKKRKRKCYVCREPGHHFSCCPKKLVADSTNPDNQDNSGNMGNYTKFEAAPGDNEVDRSNMCSWTNALSSKKQEHILYQCREDSTSCPQKLAADSTIPVTVGNHLPVPWHESTSSAESMSVGTTSIQKPIRYTLVRWLLPPDPWIKLNTDGSFDSNTGLASGGGLIRDHLGDLQVAFYMPLEASSSSDAELQALLHGLHLARRFDRPIWIELDAFEIVRLLETDRPGAWQIQDTLCRVRALMAQIQKTWVTHIFREGNRPADYMATMGIGSHAMHLVYTHSAPKHFLNLVRMDQIGYPSFRVR